MTAAVQNRTPATEDTLEEFVAGYTLGYGTGQEIGWYRGRDDEREAWNRIIGVYAETIARPQSGVSNETPDQPCAMRCRRCSVCTRYESAWRNQRSYDSPDFPGGRVPTW